MSASSSSSPNESTNYHCDRGHKLIKAGKEAVLKECKYCKDQIFDLGSSYKCTHCEGELKKYFHEACLKAKRNSTKAYPFIPRFQLKFSPGKEGNINCTACRHSVRGIMYTGSHENKDYDLHPQCIELPRNLARDSMELKLCCRMQTSMKYCHGCRRNENWYYGYISNGNFEYACQTSMKCHFCEMNNDQGWCYGKISNGKFEYAFHVRCLKKRLAREWFKDQIPDARLPSRHKKYFDENLYRNDLQKILETVRFSVKAAALVLDLVISAFVGAPLATLLSLVLDVTAKIAQERLKDAVKELQYGRN